MKCVHVLLLSVLLSCSLTSLMLGLWQGILGLVLAWALLPQYLSHLEEDSPM